VAVSVAAHTVAALQRDVKVAQEDFVCSNVYDSASSDYSGSTSAAAGIFAIRTGRSEQPSFFRKAQLLSEQFAQ
jgi:hypothetical protein